MSTKNIKDTPLHQLVEHAMQEYFAQLEGQMVSGVYDMVLQEVEKPLLTAVMRYTENNQSKAAQILGLNRGTLRTKLKQHQLI